MIPAGDVISFHVDEEESKLANRIVKQKQTRDWGMEFEDFIQKTAKGRFPIKTSSGVYLTKGP